MISAYKHPTKPVYQKPIVICSAHPSHTASRRAIVAGFGMLESDFFWLSDFRKTWKNRIMGLSRTALVLDPMDVLLDHDDKDFVEAVRLSFDRIGNSVTSLNMLSDWLRDHNPDAHRRMLASRDFSQNTNPSQFANSALTV